MLKKRLLNRQVHSDFAGCLINNQMDSAKLHQLIKDYSDYPIASALYLLTQLLKLAKKHNDSQTLLIESSESLSKADQDLIAKKYQDYSVNKIETELNASLLAGIKVRIGDNVYEDSVRSRIAQLKTVING